MSRARLVPVSGADDAARSGDVDGLVLVLHGGGSRQADVAVSPTQLSVLRMVPVARRVARAGRGRLAVYRLLNSVRGWDAHHTPVADVDWALAELGGKYPDLPVGLVGHSLGGRAALLAADRDPVRSVVALNPYLLPEDAPRLEGRTTVIVHGDRDRIASIDAARRLAARAGSARPAFVTVAGGKHAMLSRGSVFERIAADVTAAVLTGREPRRGSIAAQVLAGERALTA